VTGVAGHPSPGEALAPERLRRLLDAMAARQVDACVLGRPGAVALVSAARQLWTAGTRPFGPAAVVVAATGAVHLMSTWDEGVPEAIGHEQLYGLTWNPRRLRASLAAIPGLADAATVATDSLNPGGAQLLGQVAPRCRLVDAGPLLAAAGRPKGAGEHAGVEAAVRVAESALQAMAAALRPGTTARRLAAVYLERVAALGCPAPPYGDVARTGGPPTPPGTAELDSTPLGEGQLVVLTPAALRAGYQGGLARTGVAGGKPSSAQRRLAERVRQAATALVDACRPGAAAADLTAAAGGADWWWVHGQGLGAEPPVAGPGIESGLPLLEGDVLWVYAAVSGEAGTVGEGDSVVVTAGPPRLLSGAPYGLA
jgi:Xaa-Pro dipeptidase